MSSDINGNSSYDYFGWSVDINYAGDRIVVGAPYDDNGGSNSGSVSVFDWNGTSWVQVGNNINGTSNSEYFGWSVAINDFGDKILAGAPDNDNGGTDVGQVKIMN